MGFCLTWIVWNRTHYLPHFDNDDLTYLNLLLSILAEVSAITILVYTLRIEGQNIEQSRNDHDTITFLKDTLERIEQKLDK